MWTAKTREFCFMQNSAKAKKLHVSSAWGTKWILFWFSNWCRVFRFPRSSSGSCSWSSWHKSPLKLKPSMHWNWNRRSFPTRNQQDFEQGTLQAIAKTSELGSQICSTRSALRSRHGTPPWYQLSIQSSGASKPLCLAVSTLPRVITTKTRQKSRSTPNRSLLVDSFWCTVLSTEFQTFISQRMHAFHFWIKTKNLAIKCRLLFACQWYRHDNLSSKSHEATSRVHYPVYLIQFVAE